jgi:hypothetical protein
VPGTRRMRARRGWCRPTWRRGACPWPSIASTGTRRRGPGTGHGGPPRTSRTAAPVPGGRQGAARPGWQGSCGRWCTSSASPSHKRWNSRVSPEYRHNVTSRAALWLGTGVNSGATAGQTANDSLRAPVPSEGLQGPMQNQNGKFVQVSGSGREPGGPGTCRGVERAAQTSPVTRGVTGPGDSGPR